MSDSATGQDVALWNAAQNRLELANLELIFGFIPAGTTARLDFEPTLVDAAGTMTTYQMMVSW